MYTDKMSTFFLFPNSIGFNTILPTMIFTVAMLSCSVNSTFTSVLLSKSSLQGTYLEVYETQNDAQSNRKCVTLCARQIPTCLASDYDPLARTCDLYTKGSNVVHVSSVNVFLFTVPDIFHAISINGRHFSILKSSVTKPYSDARTHCQNLGGYLLQFDSPEEYEAVESLVTLYPTEYYSFVGFNDIASESQWVTDRDNNPARSEDLVWHAPPDNYDGNEDCAVIIHESPAKLGDVTCTNFAQFLCERDV